MIVVLDAIRSSENVGSIFRTADAMGIEKIVLCGYTPGPLDRFQRENTRLTKASLGAEKTVVWEHATTALEAVHGLRAQGYTIACLEQASNSIPLDDFAAAPPVSLALVVGNEVDGVSPEVLAAADVVLEIPMLGQKESLNVSVSFGIAAYGLRKGTNWRVSGKRVQ